MDARRQPVIPAEAGVKTMKTDLCAIFAVNFAICLETALEALWWATSEKPLHEEAYGHDDNSGKEEVRTGLGFFECFLFRVPPCAAGASVA